MCVFISCQYGCLSKTEHHSKYAGMRRNIRIVEIQKVTRSPKINWNIVEELKLDKPIVRKKKENHNEEILDCL